LTNLLPFSLVHALTEQKVYAAGTSGQSGADGGGGVAGTPGLTAADILINIIIIPILNDVRNLRGFMIV
jgi:hypothetical protein